MTTLYEYERECDEIDEYMQRVHTNVPGCECVLCRAVFDEIERENKEAFQLRESIGA